MNITNLFFLDQTMRNKLFNEIDDIVTKIKSSIQYLLHGFQQDQLINTLEAAKSYYDEQNEAVKIISKVYMFLFISVNR